MRKTTFAVLAIALVAAALVSEANGAVFKIATLAPDGSSWMEAARRGADDIARRTEGRVTFRFYPGGTMGNDQAVLRKIRIGQLQGGALTAGGLAAVWPDVQIYSLPLLFRSQDEVDAVRREMDEEILAGLAQRGFVAFGLVEAGFAYLMSAAPVRTFADLAGRKPWLPEGDSIGAAIFEAAGVAPIPLPLTDVLTGLQTGLIDTVASSPLGAVALQWFTRVRYLTDTPLIYVYGTLVVDAKAFERLSEIDREVVREVMSGVVAALDDTTRRDNQAAREALRSEGIEFITLAPDARADWERVAAEATRKLAERGEFSAVTYAALERHLASARGGVAP